MEILGTIVENLTDSLVGIGGAIGSSLSNMAEAIFMTTVEGVTTLSTFGGLVTIFAGISLAFGLTRWVLNFITSLGARNN